MLSIEDYTASQSGPPITLSTSSADEERSMRSPGPASTETDVPREDKSVISTDVSAKKDDMINMHAPHERRVKIESNKLLESKKSNGSIGVPDRSSLLGVRIEQHLSSSNDNEEDFHQITALKVIQRKQEQTLSARPQGVSARTAFSKLSYDEKIKKAQDAYARRQQAAKDRQERIARYKRNIEERGREPRRKAEASPLKDSPPEKTIAEKIEVRRRLRMSRLGHCNYYADENDDDIAGGAKRDRSESRNSNSEGVADDEDLPKKRSRYRLDAFGRKYQSNRYLRS